MLVGISQLTRSSRGYGSYKDFFERVLLLTRKLLNTGFLMIRFGSLRKLLAYSLQLRQSQITNPAGAAGLLLHRMFTMGKFTMGKLKSFP
jgi:hypothetical protein